MLFKQFKQSFRLSEVHNGMDRLKPSPAGQMNRRSRSRDRDNWRGKMRRETGRCRGFPCFSMSICLIWCQKLVRNLGACSRYKVDAFLLFFSNAIILVSSPGSIWRVDQVDSRSLRQTNKNQQKHGIWKRDFGLATYHSTSTYREWIYWKVRSRPSWQPSEGGQLCAESVRSGRSAGRHWIWIWDTSNVMSLKNLKNRSERGGFHRCTTRRQRFASRWLKVGRETLTPSSWICPFEGVCSAESLECTAHHWNKEQLTPENPGVKDERVQLNTCIYFALFWFFFRER